MTKIQRFQNAEVQIPYLSTASRFYFGDIPNLRFVSMLNIESYNATVYGPLSVLSQLPVVDPGWATGDVWNNICVVLYYNDRENTNRIPINEFFDIAFTNTPWNFLRTTYMGQQVVWSKSYIVLNQSLDWNNIPVQTDFVVPFGVYYA